MPQFCMKKKCAKKEEADRSYLECTLVYYFVIDWSFKLRYCMNFYLNWHRNCERSEFELSNLLNKKTHVQL